MFHVPLEINVCTPVVISEQSQELSVAADTARIRYLGTAAHHQGAREQWRPGRAGGGTGCCSDCPGSRPGVWEGEAGQVWGRPWGWRRPGAAAGGRAGRAAEGGSGCRGRRGRSACLWSLVSDKERTTDCSGDVKNALSDHPRGRDIISHRSRSDRLWIAAPRCRR